MSKLCTPSQEKALARMGITNTFGKMTKAEAHRILSFVIKKKEPKSVDALRKMPYKQYLQTRHWKRLRIQVFQRCGKCCERCGVQSRDIEVHHLTYERLGEEKLYDLLALCGDCHDEEHGFRAPGAVRNASRKMLEVTKE